MPFTGDPINSVTDRLRLMTGDVDEFDEGYADAVYQYAYEKNDKNEARAAVEVLGMLVTKYANYVTQKAGGLFVKESERYQQYKDTLKRLTTDPRYGILSNGVGFTGGVSIQVKSDYNLRSDSRENPLGTDLQENTPAFLPYEYYRSQ